MLQIFQSVVEEWQLPPAKILQLLTKNCSNISAFKIEDNDKETENNGTTNSDGIRQCEEEEEVEDDNDEENLIMPSVDTEIEENDKLEEENHSTFSCYK